MFKTIICTIVGLAGFVEMVDAQAGCSSSQNLLYYVSSEPRNQFMVPFIETTLHDLVLASNKDCHLFSSVNSLNIMMESRFVENNVIEFYTFLNPDSSINQSVLAERDREVSDALNKADKFLIISIKPFNELLEYDFILYNIEKKQDSISGKQINGVPVLSYLVGSSTFVDPKSSNYKSEIAFAIKQVFQASNICPVVKIKSLASNSTPTNFFSSNDTISLNAIVIDNDSPRERISYHWMRSTEMKDDRVINFLSETDDAAQKIIITENGIFSFAVWVTDGIGISDTANILIHIIDKPVIDSLYENDDLRDNIVDIKYHSYLVRDDNYYDSLKDIHLTLKKIGVNENPTLSFAIYPLDKQIPNLSFRAGDSTEYEAPNNFSDTLTDLVICSKVMTYSRIDSTYKASIRLFQNNQKVLGTYALYVAAKEKTVESRSRLMILRYSNVLPIDFSIEYVGLSLMRGNNLHGMLPCTLRMNCHLFPMLDFGLKIDVPFSGVVDTLLHIQPFLHPNLFGSVAVNYSPVFPKDGFALQSFEIHLGNFHYMRSKSCFSGGLSTSIRLCRVEQWTEFIRFSWDFLPIPNPRLIDGLGLYNIFSFQAGFIYQPIRSL